MAARAALIALAALGCLAAPAAAHRLAPSLLELREESPGVFEAAFKQALPAPRGTRLTPQLPGHCRWLGTPVLENGESSTTLRRRVDCGATGLVGGRVGVAGLDGRESVALLRIALVDGRRLRALLDAGSPEFRVPARESRLDVVADYLWLGARHVWAGADHLLFVLGLLLLVVGARAALLAVSSFTLGHSLTLSLAALGFVGVPPSWAELAIAASILVLAVELAEKPGASRLRRRPWEAAGLFGLVHGLGFAGALAETGLPQGEIPLALVSFNTGIEVGQLAFVAGVWLLRPWLRRASPVPAYAMGSLAAFWCLQRLQIL